MQLDAGVPVDRYVVEGLLGRGGMAVVYRVRHRQLGSLHALKVLLVQAPSIQERLLQEGRAQSAFRHGNVVAVTDAVEVRGCPALVLEYVDGPPLDRFLATTRLTLAQADHLARGILKGMAAAHRQGLVHRDLKPGNVLLAIQDGEIVPKVSDFGLAKLLRDDSGEHQRTRTGATLGTPAYMAPEQVKDARSVDGRADVFALGAILYELATGQRAFHGENAFDVMNAVVEGRFAPPRSLVPDLPERMERAILGALTLDRDQRTPTVDALLEIWRGEAPSAPPPAWSKDQLSVPPAPPPAPTSADTWAGDGSLPALTTPVESLPEAVRSPVTPATPRMYAAAFALGTVFGIPFLLGDMGLLFLDPFLAIQQGGAFALVLLIVSALAIGGLVAGAIAEHHGKEWNAPWMLVPAAITGLGSLGTWMGTSSIRAALETGVPPDQRSTLAAWGTSEVLVNMVAGSASASSLFVCAAVAIALATQRRVHRTTIPPRAVTSLGIGLTGGMALWLAHPWLSGQAGLGWMEPFPVYLVLAIVTAAVASLASDELRPETFRARLITAGAGAFAVAHAARTVDTRYLMQAAAGFAEGAHVPGDVSQAEAFVSSIGAIAMAPSASWAALSLLAALPVLTDGIDRRAFRIVGYAALALAIVGPLKRKADVEVGLLAQGILPGEIRAASRWQFGADLVDGDGGIEIASAEEGLPLRPGDRVVAVGNRAFDDAGSLVRALWACRCAAEGVECALGPCVAPGSLLGFTVLRPSEAGPPEKLELDIPVTAH